ncbi:MAG: hypothetical protein AVO38_04160 [delta proteobacterium ML8_D]|jgi:hypothetical protein|nr:MAG: hypothetical protein AVO38_04160 [delta proteobacterium ML8_D]
MYRIFFLITLILSLVITFGSSRAGQKSLAEQESVEALFLQWINEARSNPWVEAERLGLNVTKLRMEVGESTANQWDEGLTPLKWNERLALASTCQVKDMLDRCYYSHMNPEGLGPEQRIQSVFYDAMFFGESMGGVAFLKIISLEEAIRIIYEGLLMDALSQGPEGAPLLDPLLRDIGLCLDGGHLFFEDTWYNIYLLTCDLGRTQEPVSDGKGILYGHVFKDQNDNGRYDQGEGIQGSLVTVHGWQEDDESDFWMLTKNQIVSGRKGEYLFELLPGDYRLNMKQNGLVMVEIDRLPIDYSGVPLRVDLACTDFADK